MLGSISSRAEAKISVIITNWIKLAHFPYTDKVCGKELTDPVHGGKGFFGSNGLCVKKAFRYSGKSLAHLDTRNRPALTAGITAMQTERLSRRYLVDPVIPLGAEMEWDQNDKMDIALEANAAIKVWITHMREYSNNASFIKDHSTLFTEFKSSSDGTKKKSFREIASADKETQSTNKWNDISDYNVRTALIPLQLFPSGHLF